MRAMRRITMVATPLRATVRTNMPLRRRVRGSGMIVRPSTGWQTILADLSMILFMIAASALANTPEKAQPVAKAHAAPRIPRRRHPSRPRFAPSRWACGPMARCSAFGAMACRSGQRSAFARDDRGAPWPRRPGGRVRARRGAGAERGRTRQNARVVVEPGISRGATVTLGFDTEESASAT
jgi:hypothetical protein